MVELPGSLRNLIGPYPSPLAISSTLIYIKVSEEQDPKIFENDISTRHSNLKMVELPGPKFSQKEIFAKNFKTPRLILSLHQHKTSNLT